MISDILPIFFLGFLAMVVLIIWKKPKSEFLDQDHRRNRKREDPEIESLKIERVVLMFHKLKNKFKNEDIPLLGLIPDEIFLETDVFDNESYEQKTNLRNVSKQILY